MRSCRGALFHKRQFAAEIIVTCVRWYLPFSLSLRDVEELMAERGLSVDHTTIWRWTQTYAPEVQRCLRGQLKAKGSTWHMDETFVRIAGRWRYLFRAVDSLFELESYSAATLCVAKTLSDDLICRWGLASG